MDNSIWLQAIYIGIGATLVMDIWAFMKKHIFGIPSLDYALVARWVRLIPAGKLLHHPIMATPPVKGEKLFGWILHYLVGVAFAVAHVKVFGEAWLIDPSIAPALITGIVTLIFPFFVIQPCLGFGFAASKAPSPWKARGFSLIAHSAYGIGLYVAASIIV